MGQSLDPICDLLPQTGWNDHIQVRLKVPGVSVRERVAALGGRRPQPREELSNPRLVRPLDVSPRAADDPAMPCTPKLTFRPSAPPS